MPEAASTAPAVAVTGASGFFGRNFVAYARQRGWAVHGVARHSSDVAGLPEGVHIWRAEFHDIVGLKQAFEGCRAVVHAAATTSETPPDYERSLQTNVIGTRHVIEACRTAGVRRFIMISTQSAHPMNSSVYGRTKLMADREVERSGLDFTILRPSTIYGPGERGLFAKLVRLLERLPAIPVVGPGHHTIRPIHVDDLSGAVLACLATPRTIGRTYDLGGRDELTFNEFLRRLLDALGRRKPLVHIPLPVSYAVAWGMAFVLESPPITADNVRGINQGKRCDNRDAERDFGFVPRGFREGLAELLSAGGIPGGVAR